MTVVQIPSRSSAFYSLGFAFGSPLGRKNSGKNYLGTRYRSFRVLPIDRIHRYRTSDTIQTTPQSATAPLSTKVLSTGGFLNSIS